jgi:hypothetical protein
MFMVVCKADQATQVCRKGNCSLPINIRMSDLFHIFGQDLQLSPSGGLLMADGQTLDTQRVIRRLLTNPADEYFNVAYGAGLGQFIGQPVNEAQIAAVTRTNMYREASVQHTPPPTIQIAQFPNNVVELDVIYTDASGQRVTLNLPLGEN